MPCSIIIPTYNRADAILKMLDSMSKQTFTNFEVIISIDGSTDDTRAVVERHSSDFIFKVQSFYFPNGGRSIARNRGAERANNDLLIFYDDDCRPNPDS